MKEEVVNKALPPAPVAMEGWDNWTGDGIEDDLAYQDMEYIMEKEKWEEKKKRLLQGRSDRGLNNVILSDEISKKSMKYVCRWQPDWVNLGLYRQKMKATVGREWNLGTEYLNAVRPEIDIPAGYIVQPTEKQKKDGEDEAMNTKTSFGQDNQQKKPTEKLHSVYKSGMQSSRRKYNKWASPARARS